MKIIIQVKPNSKTERVEKLSNNTYKVFVNAPAKDNRANFATIEVLASHFNVGISKVKILKGLTSKTKLIKIYAP